MKLPPNHPLKKMEFSMKSSEHIIHFSWGNAPFMAKPPVIWVNYNISPT
jgi:hypothetical protein